MWQLRPRSAMPSPAKRETWEPTFHQPKADSSVGSVMLERTPDKVKMKQKRKRRKSVCFCNR